MKLATLPILAGIALGVLAPILVHLGNPGNMGVCAACFTRDIAGALNLHQAGIVQYIRPEVIGLVFGALIAAFIFREFRPRAGSAPIVRFMLGVFAMIGALVFLGCPWRMWLRISAGDWSAIAGVFGLIFGILIGIFFLKRGFSLGHNRPASKIVGFVFPIFVLGLLGFLIWGLLDSNTPIKFSQKGPGSMHAPLIISLIAGLFLGAIFQKSRFCMIAAVRDAVLLRDTHILQGVIALVIVAFITNLTLGLFNPGFTGQPIAHNDMLWNFLGMALAGIAFTLAGGCPGRQLILSGEGDGDAGVFIMGLLVGAAFAHNFALASSPAGIGANAPIAVIIGFIFCLLVATFAKEKH
ncbi:YedE family putative selenium transporter [Helicobacter turcicus]|uniref:YedE-related selenium metabolism membrane protein n=1 Tax=Helicobacter turcicus TaxID=2867412 RepID=A0ABS7JPP3_9HELI|nr:YedE family putative selenium transporter [Helicobacter turcicus]MBX7491373.1 YedE-related selenium metabolism membrane protein [Helicobacter turcicus]MBX7546240.1 YedE-related selenium metabolism membrane protein [Helicobacter turcicus]